jgi:hypothetical protein
MADKVASPVLDAAAARRLRASMPVEVGSAGDVETRRPYSPTEALARVLCGLAPWLEGPEPAERTERRIRGRLADQARDALASAVDTSSPDRFHLDGTQPLVEMAFLAVAFMRAPRTLWLDFDPATRRGLVDALRSTRRIRPYANNWLLFAAAIEAFLHTVGEADVDRMRVDHALRSFDGWYLGDGVYGDGPSLRVDHYNSFVIHPFLLHITDAVADLATDWSRQGVTVRARASRFAEIQERMISPEGTFPAVGRSLTYRCGALHALAHCALRRELPATLAPGRVRAALWAVVARQLGAGSTFDDDGWLRIGFVGHQPELAERYVSTGSLYLCTTVFAPLGLGADDPFWTERDERWTSVLAWGGQPVAADIDLERRRG